MSKAALSCDMRPHKQTQSNITSCLHTSVVVLFTDLLSFIQTEHVPDIGEVVSTDEVLDERVVLPRNKSHIQRLHDAFNYAYY